MKIVLADAFTDMDFVKGTFYYNSVISRGRIESGGWFVVYGTYSSKGYTERV